MFVNDLNGPLYIVDAATRSFTKYLDLNGRGAGTGLFKRFSYAIDLGNGFTTFQFDPDYRRNGRFYTVHIEEQAVDAAALPQGASAPGLHLDGYTTTAAIPVPGGSEREVVLVEWTDTDTSNATFEGTAREVLRMQINTHLHPPTDLIFNPTAARGSADWRVMYLASGDGGAGEQTDLERRNNPQRLDTLVGKILRIVPDPSEHVKTSVLSSNGRYRIPKDNPFVKIAGAHGEVWALGLRNPHRLTWEVDPSSAAKSRLIVLSVGLSGRESVYFARKGANFGYSEREGNQRLLPTNKDDALPVPDRIPLRVSNTVSHGTVAPAYPVVQYDHTKGNAIGNGFVYHGQPAAGAPGEVRVLRSPDRAPLVRRLRGNARGRRRQRWHDGGDARDLRAMEGSCRAGPTPPRRYRPPCGRSWLPATRRASGVRPAGARGPGARPRRYPPGARPVGRAPHRQQDRRHDPDRRSGRHRHAQPSAVKEEAMRYVTRSGMLVLAALALAVPLAAQTPGGIQAPQGVMADLRHDVADAHTKIVALAKALPASAYDWRPDAGVRSTGEVFKHIASENYFLPAMMGATPPAASGINGKDYDTVGAYRRRR